jgi:hypothetical protein
LNLQEILIQPVQPNEQERFQSLMKAHHYLGVLPKIGHTLWYVASYPNEWLALISFSAAAWKCAARDQWIGWSYRVQYNRLHLIANNSRFLILRPNTIILILRRECFPYVNVEFLRIGSKASAIPYYC